MPNFIDIFAGCGGLSLGLMQAGWKGLFAVERDTNAFQTLHHNLAESNSRYKYNWPSWLPQTPHDVSDILTQFNEPLSNLQGKVDMLVGGPPCQGFSNAGRRDPSDPRNELIKSYLEFVNIVKPRAVLIENVRGMTSDFKESEKSNKKLNYANWLTKALSTDYFVSTNILDLSRFGVPQRRHRFFIIAFRKDSPLIDDQNPFETIEENRNSFLRFKGIHSTPVSSKLAISDLETSRNGTAPSRDTKGFREINYKLPLTAYQRMMNAHHCGILPDTRLAKHRPDIVTRFKQIIDLCHADGRLNVSLSSEIRASFGLRKRAIRVLDPDSPSPTITSMPDDLIHYSEPRILTVRENARLQGFPDWFAFKGKYTTGGDRRKKEVPRFTQVANAVPPLVAEAIGLTIMQLITTNSPLKKDAL